MASIWQYSNPVQVTFGAGCFDQIGKRIADRPYCLVTYGDNPLFDDLTRRLVGNAGAPAILVRDVEPNPSYSGLRTACKSLAGGSVSPEVIVALGGGSVIDSAKVLAASGDDFTRVQRYLETGEGSECLRRLPIIAVPTTAGTGSEVTSWATLWDTENQKKYSLARPDLYPEHAIVDPALALGAPRGLTVSTGLDALSHALESIWNINANPISSNYAERAARETMQTLPLLANSLDDLALRERMARASLLAGLAFSNTKTALAHSLSYHLTLHHGVPHGIACSFSLSAVMQSVIGRNGACDETLARIFGPDLDAGVKTLTRFIEDLGVSTRVADYGVGRAEWEGVINDALLGERGRNFIGERTPALELAA